MKSVRKPTPNFILNRIYPIRLEGYQGGYAHGTSFVIDYKGCSFMITAAHVAEGHISYGSADPRGFSTGHGSISIYHDGQWNEYEAKVIRHDISNVPSEFEPRTVENIDIAILEIRDFHPASGGNTDLNPKAIRNIRNFSVTVFGFPKPFMLMPVEQLPELTLTTGCFAEPPRKDMELMTHLIDKNKVRIAHVLDNFSSEGMSGGPVICEENNDFFVIAIVSKSLDSSLGFTFCSPIEYAIEIIDKLQAVE